jgi:REP element-mobilizing transposase RayT
MDGKYDPKIHHRHSIRLPWYDYSQDGWYYITLCILGNKCLLGKFIESRIQLYQYGLIVEDCWKWLAKQYNYVHLDSYVVMPNHLHGIIVIRRGGSRTALTRNVPKLKPQSRLVGAFKTVSTKQINIIRNTPVRKLWQRNYYEHIIRNEEELYNIRQYIAENPINWRKDEENPNLQPM